MIVMAQSVGSDKVIGRRFGTTEIIRVLVGAEQIWPPVQKVLYTNSVVWANSSGGSFPAHIPGDVLVVVACSYNGALPSLPAGWTNGFTSSDGGTVAMRIGWRVATGSALNTGTWTGANVMSGYVFRNADTVNPFGAIATKYTAAVSSASTPAVTPVNLKGESVLVHGYANNGSAGGFSTTIPAGFVAKNSNARMSNLMRLDSTIGAGAAMSHTGGNMGWRTVQFEVVPPAPAVEEPLYMYAVTFEYLPDYEVQFHIKKGYVSDDPNWEELIMLQSTIMGNPGPGGYCSRDPKFKFGDPGATRYVCTFEDRSGVPGDTSTRGVKISVDVYPRATVTATADAPVAADAAADRTALPIKGNKDSGLYHMPDSPYYAQTAAEETFATEAEAQAAGYSKWVRKPRKKAR